nr:hypothetical protein [Caldicellulosiruptor sp. F32]
MKRRKGLIALVIIAGILFVYIFSPLCDFATIPQKPQENSYVFDYADLIDDSDENEIRALAKK